LPTLDKEAFLLLIILVRTEMAYPMSSWITWFSIIQVHVFLHCIAAFSPILVFLWSIKLLIDSWTSL
jgi:hypothetical protein